MAINIKVVTTAEGIPQLRNVPQRSAAAVVIEGRPRARGHIDYATRRLTGLLEMNGIIAAKPFIST